MDGLGELVRVPTRRGVLARTVAFSGFGARDEREVLVLGDRGERHGRLLGGLADDAVLEALRNGERQAVIDVRVDDASADAAGLSCGGRARVLVQRLELLPDELWDALEEGQPVVLASPLSQGGRPYVVAPGTAPPPPPIAAHAADLLAGRGERQLVRDPNQQVVLEAVRPRPHLLIVGGGALADALAAQAALLGWDAVVREGTDEGSADTVALAGEAGPHDVLVVLSHDPEVDTPVLAAALQTGRGFVGALGSRATQQARRRRLAAKGLTPEQLDRLHGPVGLDLGARTPAEVAVAVVAEVLAHRAGRDARPLREGKGQLH